jgi:hypothetical protein
MKKKKNEQKSFDSNEESRSIKTEKKERRGRQLG